MAPRSLPSGTVTFVLTDIEGSTPLLKRLGPRYDEVLAIHHSIVRAAADQFGGVVVRTEGDSFIVAFAETGDAALAAVTAQRDITQDPTLAPLGVRIRIGIHRGTARVIDDDYVSLALHQATRIMAAAHGGQILASADVANTIGNVSEGIEMRDVGRFHVRDFEDATTLFEVVHPDITNAFPPPRVPAAGVHNVPSHRTTFVGRDAELEELTTLTRSAALVTLAGPGGVGKTRLACELGRLVAGRFTDGVWFVPLQGVIDGRSVGRVVATMLGVTDDAGAPTDAIAARFADASAMVILDNCEHILDEAASVVEALLGASTDVVVVATSRESLSLPVEHVFRVQPLPLPATDDGNAASVELFTQRASQVRRDVDFDEQRPIVGSICRQLDGIPLAIELVAARVEAMDLAALERSIATTELLDVSRRGGEDRQRTVRSTIAWSYDLLDAQQQAAFRRLSVFRGGFDAAAAALVAGRVRPVVEDTATVIGELVARSLVELGAANDGVRYRMLEPVRRVAEEILDADGETAGARQAHAEWVNSVTDEAQRQTAREGEGPVLARLEEEQDNIRAALQHSFEVGDTESIVSMIAGLDRFWIIRRHWREGIDVAERALEYVATDGDRARVLASLAQLLDTGGRWADARAVYAEAAEIYERLGDRASVALCENGTGTTYLHEGRMTEGRVHLERGLELAREIENQPGILASLTELGTIAFNQGDTAQSRAWFDETLERSRAIKDPGAESQALAYLGYLDAAEGETERALERFSESIELMRELGDMRGIVLAGAGRGRAALGVGDNAGAAKYFREALELSEELDDLVNATVVMRDLGNALSRDGRHDEALAYLVRSFVASRSLGSDVLAWSIAFQWALARCGQDELTVAFPVLEASVRALESNTITMRGYDLERLNAARERAQSTLGDGAAERLAAAAAAMTIDEIEGLITAVPSTAG